MNMNILHLILALLLACAGNPGQEINEKKETTIQEPVFQKNPWYSRTDTTLLRVKDEQWKKILPTDLYAVAREKDTERPFTGKYWNTDERGTYYCAVCGNRLFESDAKFSSQCGWPSFFRTVRENAVTYTEDRTYGMVRTEVTCTRCQSHLGHIFDDGPPPTGKRFCMNSVSLDFEPFARK
jgi:peptide-methionine (R)-S-oxide reductase